MENHHLISNRNADYRTMITLNVKSMPDEHEFDTFKEAIDASKRNPRYRKAELDTGLVQGSKIKSIESSFETVIFHLFNGLDLQFYLDVKKVCWRVIPCQAEKSDLLFISENCILLRFQNSPDDYIWNRTQLLNSLVNKNIHMISASSSWVSLSTIGNSEPILFMRILDIDHCRDILYFDPE